MVMGKSETYLVLESRPNVIYSLFYNDLSDGSGDEDYSGIILTSRNPTALGLKEEKYQEVYWITDTVDKGKNNISSTGLNTVTKTIVEYLEKNGPSIVLIDAFERLITNNESAEVLKSLERIVDECSLRKSPLYIRVNPKAVDPMIVQKLITMVDHTETEEVLT